MDVHQQSRVPVASDSLVHRRESVFGAEVNMSPSLDQHPDGLTSAGFALHGKGQGSFCQKNKHTTHLLIKKKKKKKRLFGSKKMEWPFYGYLEAS